SAMTRSFSRRTIRTATRISPTQWRSSLKWTEYRRKVRRRFCGITARGYMGSMDDKRILDFGLRGKGMKLKSLKRVRNSFSDNPKPVVSNVEPSAIQNLY